MYKYYNPNPKARFDKNGKPQKWHVCDCVIRAISCATGESWRDVYKTMCHIGEELWCMPNDRKAMDAAMKKYGFVKVSYKKGTERDLVKDFSIKHSNKIAILNLSGHVVCCKEGHYWDTWDCGNKTAYDYWIKEN